jgi:hypothetical protein
VGGWRLGHDEPGWLRGRERERERENLRRVGSRSEVGEWVGGGCLSPAGSEGERERERERENLLCSLSILW